MKDLYETMGQEAADWGVADGPAMKAADQVNQTQARERETAALEPLKTHPMNQQMPSKDLYAYGEAAGEGVNLDPQPIYDDVPTVEPPESDVPTVEPPQDVTLPNKYFKPEAMTIGGHDMATGEHKLSTPKAGPSWTEDVVLGGITDAVHGVLDLRRDIGEALGLDASVGQMEKVLAQMAMPKVEAGEGLGRTIPRALTQFAIPYAGAAKMIGTARALGAARFGKELMASGMATQVFDPEDGTLATLIKNVGWDESDFAEKLKELGLPVDETLAALDSELQTQKRGRLAGRLTLLAEDSLLGLVVPAVFALTKASGKGLSKAYKNADFKGMQDEALKEMRESSTTLNAGADPTDMIPLTKLALAKMGQGMNTIEGWVKSFEGDAVPLRQKTMSYVNAFKEGHEGALPYTVSKQATHFSRTAGVDTLEAARYGTGVRGKDLARTDAVDRVHFYHGDFEKERQLGNVEYNWQQDNLYDFKEDPLNFLQIAKDDLNAEQVKAGIEQPLAPAAIATRKEQLIKDAGYSGYVISEPGGRQTRNAGVTFGDVDLRPPLGDRMPRVNKSGQYVGLPAGVNTPEKFDKWMGTMGNLVDQGIEAKDWYKDSATAIFRAAGGSMELAEKLSMMLAVTSQGADVKSNTGFALKAWYQHINGLPVDTGRFPTSQGPKIQNILNGNGEAWMKGEKGRKTATFHGNLMADLNQERFREMGLVTNDMWVARAAGMPTDKFTPVQYEATEQAMIQLAKDRGLTPHQAQAALWTAIRGRYESTKAAFRAEGKAKGILKKDGAPRKGMKERARRLQRKLAMGMGDMTPKQFGEAAYNFGNAFEDYYGQISLEAIPSTTTPMGAWLTSAPTAVKAEYSKDIFNTLLDANGSDIMAEALGIPQGAMLNGPGFWQGASNPSLQMQVPLPVRKAPMLGPDGKQMKSSGGQLKWVSEIDATVTQKLDEYSEAMATLLDQDAVGYHQPLPTLNHGEANGIQLTTGAPLTAGQTVQLGDVMRKAFGDDVGVVASPQGVRILNFTDQPNVEWQGKVVELLEQATDLPDTTVDFFKSQGKLVNQNKGKYHGKSNNTGVRARGRSDVLRRHFDVLAEKVKEVNTRYQEQYAEGF